MIFESPPRSRRRAAGRLLWPLLIIGAVTLGLVVSAAGAETREQIAYLSEVHDHSVQMSRNGDALRGLASRLVTISRDEVETVVAAIEEDIGAALEFIEGEPPVDSIVPIRSMFRQAVVAWQTGVVGWRDSVLAASDRPGDTTVVDSMATALAELRAGDQLYLDLLAELERGDIPEPLNPLPDVVMMPRQGGLVSLSVLFVEDARSPDNSLTLRPELAVSQIVAEPLFQVDANEDVVLPSTETVEFSVVITNSGNVASEPGKLVLTLRTQTDTETREMVVPALQPGLQITLVFDPFDVEPGEEYEVTAGLEVVGPDVDPEDNLITIRFTVNPN